MIKRGLVMGRFEKKIKNRIEDEANKLGGKVCNFEEWRKDNRADLAGFSESGKSAKGGAKVAVKAAWAVSALAAIFLLLPSGGGDKGVSDDSINSSAENVRDITKEEFEEIAVKFPFVLGFEIAEGAMHTGQDGLPALAEISGEERGKSETPPIEFFQCATALKARMHRIIFCGISEGGKNEIETEKISAVCTDDIFYLPDNLRICRFCLRAGR